MKISIKMDIDDIIKHLDKKIDDKILFVTKDNNWAEIDISFPNPETVVIDMEQNGDTTTVEMHNSGYDIVKYVLHRLKSAINSLVSEENGNPDQQAIQEENLQQRHSDELCGLKQQCMCYVEAGIIKTLVKKNPNAKKL